MQDDSERVLFGVAGNSESFYAAGFSDLMDVPQYLKNFELEAYEYQCGHGIRLVPEKAQAFFEVAAKAGLFVSIHSPYYISLSSLEKSKREKSVGYILQTAKLAKQLGAKRVIVHSGSAGKMERCDALEFAKETLKKAKEQMVLQGLHNVALCPETMGKINQLGTLPEVIELCLVDESFIPCVDFGHINAREQGALQEKQDFEKLLNLVENKLGADRMKSLHVHFSKIEFTKGGEKKHLTFEDENFGPRFENMLDAIIKKGCHPVIICESKGTQAEDARTMKKYYQKHCNDS